MLYPPGPKGKFLLGSLRDLKAGRHEFLADLRRQYGDIVHFKVGPVLHMYMLNNPDDIHYVLVDAPEKFHKGPALKRTTKMILGEGLLTSEDEFHKRQRRLAQPAFHAVRIASYAEAMVDNTTAMLDTWQPGQQHDIHEEMMKL